MPPALYRLYGLTIRSSLDLPCPRAQRALRPEVKLSPGAPGRFKHDRPRRRARAKHNDWFQSRRLGDCSTYLRWEGLFEFLVSGDGHNIQYQAMAGATPESFTTYLLGQVLSFSLLAFGDEPLHGTAVAVDGKAVAFLGGGGSGKSTIGAAFLSRGYAIISDDLLALEPSGARYAVHPGVPRIKLFPGVARRILGVEGGPRLNAGTSKQVLPLADGQACRRRLRLAALYVLDPPSKGAGRIAIEPLKRADALLETIRHSFNTVVLERARLARQFGFASRLVERVPVKRLSYPRSLALLPAVCDAVLADLERRVRS